MFIRRGLKADLPILAEGEFGFCTDTKELFIGSINGNVLFPNQSVIDQLSAQTVKSINNTPPDEKGNVTIQVTGGGYANNVDLYKLESIGELFLPPENYNAWCPSNLRYDPIRKVFACLINGANQHVFTTLTLYFCTINPDTLVASIPKPISAVDTSGNPVKFDVTSSNNFIVLNDGTYMYFIRKSGIYHRITSVDGGTTWIDQGAILSTPSLGSNYNIWGITKLSNGRLICGFGEATETRAKIMYSDDKGVNWRFISVGKTVPSGTTSAEPCIIEVGPNKLISLARKSTSGMSYGTVGGAVDPALISYSTDNGATWTDYVDSTSILKMNASGATAVVHDGMVEVFTASRLFTTIDNVNTGQTGILYHYTATTENAFNDKFTLKETVLCANATNSGDFHSPCISIDDKNRVLLVYMDASEILANAVNYYFARGNLGYISYKNRDHTSSPVFGYSGKYIDSLISKLLSEINSLKYSVSQIPGSNVTPPSGTLLWTKQYKAENDNVTIDKSAAFSGIINTITDTGYDSLETDSNSIKYNKLGNSFGISITSVKPNFSISYKGTISNQLRAPIAAAIIGGVGYGIISVYSNFNIPNPSTEVHEYRFEYWKGSMRAFIDEIDVSAKIKTFTFDSTNVIPYTQLMNVIGTLNSTKIYAISAAGGGGKVYEVKYGEWDS
ncbi:exo-alpha-sialidase [Paenibacillus cremeus]|uniref:Exo-alpha-sialidase n=2 Tax=Paenibacillus cremeus TaxID=2163881 RepID=A0A559K560_9BACL|nr:exo-alpha-sialidase [Paenibacillus cremeus]